jgi:hypothetical protein
MESSVPKGLEVIKNSRTTVRMSMSRLCRRAKMGFAAHGTLV